MGQQKRPEPGPISRQVARIVTERLHEMERPRSWLADKSGIPATTLSPLARGLAPWYIEHLEAVAPPLDLDPASIVERAQMLADREAASVGDEVRHRGHARDPAHRRAGSRRKADK